MKQTEYSRRVDSSGRIIIPSQLRDELDIRPGDTHEFYIHEHEGKTYLCIECFRVEDEVEKAKRILREAGIKIGS
jgi:AbrB family looped-hinge helix DNA binding protein